MSEKHTHDAALEVQGLSVHYGASPVLWDLSLSIPKGHLVGIMGPNGAGKTTFIRAILDLIHKSTGSVHLLGHRLNAVRRKIAYVPQRTQVDWNFPMTVYDLVLMGCYPKRGLFGRFLKEDYDAVAASLQLLGLTKLKTCQIGQLSGGQQQRVFLARSIVQKAELYFLDEPFSGIDIVSEQILMDVLREIQNEGKTVFIVHHDLVTAEKYFDWAVLLNTALIANGPMSKVFTAENLRLAYGSNITLIEDLLRTSSHVSRGICSDIG
jgi:manganese/zinc/iron transport system ATP- binding protein